MSRKLNRRVFLGQLTGVTAATLAAKVVGVPPFTGITNDHAEAAMGPLLPAQRRQDAYQLRQQAALYQRTLPLLDHRSNGDEDRYANKIASYTKGLPHKRRFSAPAPLALSFVPTAHICCRWHTRKDVPHIPPILPDMRPLPALARRC